MAARRHLTHQFMQAAKPAALGKRYTVEDDVVPGLLVRVDDAGTKTFLLRKSLVRKKTERGLGVYPGMSLFQARETARQRMGFGSRHKFADQRDGRKRGRKFKVARFGKAAEDYIAGHLVRLRSGSLAAGSIRRVLIARWGDWRLDEIGKSELTDFIEEYKARGALRAAYELFRQIRAIYNWAIERGKFGIEESPCDRIKPTRWIGVSFQPRVRILTETEIGALWRAAEAHGYPQGRMIQMLLLTGQRRGEVVGASWPEFDLERRIWTIPPERYKVNQTHLVPLAPAIVELLARLPRWESGAFLFTNDRGRRQATGGYARSKRILNHLMEAEIGVVPPWVVQDIRRTVRTQLSALKVPEKIAEMVIGHSSRGIIRVYDHHRHGDEVREALELWATRLAKMVEETAPRPESATSWPPRAEMPMSAFPVWSPKQLSRAETPPRFRFRAVGRQTL